MLLNICLLLGLKKEVNNGAKIIKNVPNCITDKHSGKRIKPMSFDQKTALLKTQLQLPMITRDILSGTDSLDSDAIYALSDMLSSYTPEKALLTCALSMKEIASFEGIEMTDLKFLHMECDRLIERYYARIELEETNPDLWEETQGQSMESLSEDLDGFIELITLCQLSFDITDKTLSKLTHIMNIQLQSQLMIVDQVIDLIGETANGRDHIGSVINTGYIADNVVIFPG